MVPDAEYNASFHAIALKIYLHVIGNRSLGLFRKKTLRAFYKIMYFGAAGYYWRTVRWSV